MPSLRLYGLDGHCFVADVTENTSVNDFRALCAPHFPDIPPRKLIFLLGDGTVLDTTCTVGEYPMLLAADAPEKQPVYVIVKEPYAGAYWVEIQMNGPDLLHIGDDGSCTRGPKKSPSVHGSIEWEDERSVVMSFLVKKTTTWAHRATKGKHVAETGVTETIRVTFNGPTGKDGFKGKFQRTYEGMLDITGTLHEGV
eukprot:GEMP01097033.1.p1 GENE.GEMP01097033.1~~GEMP01097033.1.p1  ORF type:complete len:197 (+),score=44.75 GEMP01097033.1:87-677(+)